MTDMYLWTCTDHDGRYLGGVSVVLAETEERATDLLTAALYDAGLNAATGFTLKRHSLTDEYVEILNDGNY